MSLYESLAISLVFTLKWSCYFYTHSRWSHLWIAEKKCFCYRPIYFHKTEKKQYEKEEDDDDDDDAWHKVI